MSWWVTLQDEHKKPVKVTRFQDGGTQPIGGTDEAKLNVTYNYYVWFNNILGFSLEHLDAMPAMVALPYLKKAVALLGTERDSNYWKDTPGNAGAALQHLVQWAEQYPNATFKVT